MSVLRWIWDHRPGRTSRVYWAWVATLTPKEREAEMAALDRERELKLAMFT